MKYKIPVLNGINFGVIGGVGTWAFFLIAQALSNMASDSYGIKVLPTQQILWGILIGIIVGFLIGLFVEFIFRNRDNYS